RGRGGGGGRGAGGRGWGGRGGRSRWSSSTIPAGRAEGPIHQQGRFSTGAIARTSRRSCSTSPSPTLGAQTDANVGPCTTHTRPSSCRVTMPSPATSEKRSGLSANSRRSSGSATRERALRGELVGDRERLVERREPFVELVAGDRQRRAAHDDVPVRHQVEPAVERTLGDSADRLGGVAAGVERHEGFA